MKRVAIFSVGTWNGPDNEDDGTCRDWAPSWTGEGLAGAVGARFLDCPTPAPRTSRRRSLVGMLVSRQRSGMAP